MASRQRTEHTSKIFVVSRQSRRNRTPRIFCGNIPFDPFSGLRSRTSLKVTLTYYRFQNNKPMP